MPSVTLTKVIKPANGPVRFRFGKREYEFASVADARAAVAERLNRDDLEWIAMAIALSRQPNLNNPAALEGRTITVDPSLPSWGVIA